MEKRKIILSFSRDFNQWINQLVREQHVFNFPRVWGVGLSDQITYFDGRTFEWWRYQDEIEKIKDYMTHQPLSADVFSQKSVNNFLQLVSKLKNLSAQNPRSIKNPFVHLEKLEFLFNALYPWYPLSIFIPGVWRETLLKIHGVKAKKIINRFSMSRKKSEGLPNLVGDHLRRWLGHYLEKIGQPSDYVKFLSVEETRNLVSRGILPSVRTLRARAQGYMYFQGKIYLTSNFRKFFRDHRLIAEITKVSGIKELKGTVAQGNKYLVTGRVQTILGTAEVAGFKRGSILVAPMTVPTFLPAIKIAKAIVTDEGGALCHAAIIARELKKPCVIGTKIATKVFKDGDRVEVDAERAIVRKIL